MVGVPESTAHRSPPQQSGQSFSADARLARETWSPVVVYATAEHRASAVGKYFLRQPSRGSLFGGGTTVLIAGCESDRSGNGRRPGAAAAEAPARFNQSGHDQAGVTRSASGNFHEHSPDYALRLRRSGSPRSGNGRSAPVRHGFF